MEARRATGLTTDHPPEDPLLKRAAAVIDLILDWITSWWPWVSRKKYDASVEFWVRETEELDVAAVWSDAAAKQMTQIGLWLAAALAVGDTLDPAEPDDQPLIGMVERLTDHAASWLAAVDADESGDYSPHGLLAALARANATAPAPTVTA